jgi:hypothetical protein
VKWVAGDYNFINELEVFFDEKFQGYEGSLLLDDA